MKWFILLVGIVVLCFFVALILGWAGGLGGGLGRPTSSLSHEPLPDGALHHEDLDELRFDVTFRGYRMSQVDGVLERLRRELREKDEHIAFLGGVAGAGTTDEAADEAPDRAPDHAADRAPDHAADHGADQAADEAGDVNAEFPRA